eukprot:scaffold8143_cov142-Skeletonema_marinoi.AAC.1
MDGYGVLSKMMWWCETAVQLQKAGRQHFCGLGRKRRTVGAKEEGNKSFRNSRSSSKKLFQSRDLQDGDKCGFTALPITYIRRT